MLARPFDPIELAKLESAVTGVLSGVILAVVVLLIDRLSHLIGSSQRAKAYGEASIMVAVLAFCASTLASFLFSLNGAFHGGQEASIRRAFAMLPPPGMLFCFSVVLLAHAMALASVALRFQRLLGLMRHMLDGVIAVTLSLGMCVALEVLSVMRQTPFADTLRTPGTFAGVAGILWAGPCGVRWWRRCIQPCASHRRRVIIRRGFDGFAITSVWVIAAGSLLAGARAASFGGDTVPFWQVVLPLGLYSFLVAWSMVYIPAAE